MALATRCPHCQALFRVVADQLKLRGGLVRCGACRHVFDAIGSLTYVDDAAAKAAPAAPRAAAPLTLRIQPEHETFPRSTAKSDEHARAEARPSADPTTAAAAPTGSGADPMLRSADGKVAESSVPTLLAPGADALGRETGEHTAAPTGRTAAADGEEGAELRRERMRLARSRSEARVPEAHHEQPVEIEPVRESASVVGEPEFLRGSERRAWRGFSIVFGGGSALLAIVLLAQLAVVFRTDLATRWPPLRPALVQLCEIYGCTVGWATRAELLAVVGTELQAIPGTDVLELTTVVRNRANFKVALPAIEVTLTDTHNRTVARKVFAPVDYLASAGEPSSRIDDGLAAGADYTIRIAFEARGLTAAGFVVYPFYL